MKSENIPEWKLKHCDNCEEEYLKGTGITKIWLLDEDKYEDYPDWKYIQFEGIKELEGKSYCILCFCGDKCLNEFLLKKES